MTMLMSPPSTANAALAVVPTTDVAPAALSPVLDVEAASDDALSAILAILDVSFRVNEESGIEEALQLLGTRVTAEKIRIRARYGEAGREALAGAESLLRTCRQLADPPAVASA